MSTMKDTGEVTSLPSPGDASSSLLLTASRPPWIRFVESGQLFLTSLTGNTLRRRFASGAIWSLVAAVIGQGSTVLASIVCARILGRKGFGEFGIIQSTLGMFGVLAGMGLGLTTMKYVAEFRAIDKHRAGRIIGCTSLVAVFTGATAMALLFLLAPLLSARVINAPQLAPELRIASLLVLFSALTGTQTGALAGFEAFRTIAGVNLLIGLITLPLTVVGVLFGRLPGAVWAVVASAAIGCAISSVALRRISRRAGVGGHFAGAWKERRILWSFAVPAFLSNVVLAPVAWISSAILVNQSNGYDEMGVFNAANQWRAVLLFVPSVMGQVLIPMTSSMSRDNKRGIRSATGAAIAVNALCSAPILIALLFMSRSIMTLYGPSFSGHGTVLKLTAATGALLAIQVPIGNLIAGLGRMWIGALQNLGWAIVLTTSAWWFVSRGWGAEGLALAYLVAYLCHAAWTFWFGLRLLKVERGTR